LARKVEARPACLRRTDERAGDGDLDKRGTLCIVAIGVDRYPVMGNTCGNGSQSCDLRFAGADARA
jgi:hypothetical protein